MEQKQWPAGSQVFMDILLGSRSGGRNVAGAANQIEHEKGVLIGQVSLVETTPIILIEPYVIVWLDALEEGSSRMGVVVIVSRE